MTEQWQRLLISDRAPKVGDVGKSDRDDEYRSPFEGDFDRVMYSSAFRRLARKTQVHPLSLNDHVRTRLTHSLEVACVGRTLGYRLDAWLRSRNELPDSMGHSDLAWIMMAACAAHDIGNPPFGHAGEHAIRSWVQKHEAKYFETDNVSHAVRADFKNFEGNAQGFRIAARSDNPKTGYLRLTYATLGAMTKYPWDSCDPRTEEIQKHGVFSTEHELFKDIFEQMGLAKPNEAPRRHPMSFLTEAADDICYRMMDLEDAVEIGILDADTIRNIYDEAIGTKDATGSLGAQRGRAIRKLIDAAWDVFENDYEAIMAGSREQDLKSSFPKPLANMLDKVKKQYQQIFAEPSKVATELGAYKTLGRILGVLCASVKELSGQGTYIDCSFICQRCLELAWGQDYVEKNEDRGYEWWLHQALDHVAGLTDNYARRLSREIEGT